MKHKQSQQNVHYTKSFIFKRFNKFKQKKKVHKMKSGIVLTNVNQPKVCIIIIYMYIYILQLNLMFYNIYFSLPKDRKVLKKEKTT